MWVVNLNLRFSVCRNRDSKFLRYNNWIVRSKCSYKIANRRLPRRLIGPSIINIRTSNTILIRIERTRPWKILFAFVRSVVLTSMLLRLRVQRWRGVKISIMTLEQSKKDETIITCSWWKIYIRGTKCRIVSNLPRRRS